MDLLTNTPDVLTVMEVAQILKVGRTTMYRLVRDGKVKHLKIGRKVLIPMKYLRNFIKKVPVCDIISYRW